MATKKNTSKKGKTVLKKVEKKKKPVKSAATKKVLKKSVPKKKEVKKVIAKKVVKAKAKVQPKSKTKSKAIIESKVKTKAKTKTKAIIEPKVKTKAKTLALKAANKKTHVEKILYVQKPHKQVLAKKEEEIITPEMIAAKRSAALKKIKGYTKKELEQFRLVILEKRDEIIEQLQNLRDQILDPATGEYINENSPYSLHMAEQGTDAMEREKTFMYAQRENKFLGYLEDSLKRIDNGTYGICLECIEVQQNLCPTCPLIPKERLFAVPHSQLCLPMKQKQEKK
jgi:RNA polymerase-binding transcription factor DksA